MLFSLQVKHVDSDPMSAGHVNRFMKIEDFLRKVL